MEMVFVLATAAIIETLVVVVVVPGSEVIPQPYQSQALRSKNGCPTEASAGFHLGPLPDPGVTPGPGDQEDLCQS